MRVQAALINEQGIEFAVVSVQRHVLQNHQEAENLIRDLQTPQLFGRPTVLVADDQYYGRPDIVRFLMNFPPGALPWRWFDLN